MLRIWLVIAFLAVVGCSREDRGWPVPLPANEPSPAVDAGIERPPATAATCAKELRASLAAPVDDPNWAALAARATAECAHACDRDPADADSCAVVDRLVMHQCQAARAGGTCTKLCASAKSPSLRAAMCKHSAERALAEVASAGRRVGDRVMAKWTNGRWYPGTITRVTAQGTYDVFYDDGDRSRGLSPSRIRGGAPAAKATTSARPATRPREGASCSGPGWRHVCGGVCTDIKEDDRNCGECGHRCDDGYRCDGSGTCRDAAGRL